MHIHEAIQRRQSIRAYLDQDVSRDTIDQLLNLAAYAPSGANTQPWEVAVVKGDRKQRLADRMIAAFESGEVSEKDYTYYPTEWVQPYKSRRVACGMQLYDALAIQREDKQRRKAQWAANYKAFDAPVMLLFLMHKKMQTGSFMDFGMFLQNLMLAAMAEGLATCPQAALAEYPAIVRDELGYDADHIVVCGMALGYPDMAAAVNQYRTPREKAEDFTQYFE